MGDIFSLGGNVRDTLGYRRGCRYAPEVAARYAKAAAAVSIKFMGDSFSREETFVTPLVAAALRDRFDTCIRRPRMGRA